MCGISGLLVERCAPAPEIAVLRRMAAVLRHRGPDGWGCYRDDRVGLAHTRLSIIDLDHGHQPLANEDGTIWVAFNGEIFNFPELRRELRALGHAFRTQSDTEVIVHAFEQWGSESWRRFNGQFAFALWDRSSEELWLVRDAVGILPLYYARTGRCVLLASEAKALFASGKVRPQWDDSGLSQVFRQWSAVPPRTVFAGVESVRPGEAIRVDGGLVFHRRQWASLAFEPGEQETSLEEDADELARALRSAVSIRLRADVPVGAYLSGGLDSSLTTSLIQAEDRAGLATYSIRFAESAFDETAEQHRVQRLLGTVHREVLCRDEEIAAGLPEVVWHCETPLLRTAPVPLFLLSKLVCDSGMKVVLTGEGADEFFGGYHIFKEMRLRRFWARQPDSAWRPALFARLYPYVAGSGRQPPRVWASFFGSGLAATEDPLYSHRIRWRNTAWTRRFLAPEISNRAAGDEALEQELCSVIDADTPLGRAQAVEIATFMQPYLLSSQGDRVAMAHGVEVRYPFLDPNVIDLALRLPDRRKLRGLKEKYLLRVVAARSLPEDVARRPKLPYRAPMTTPFFGRSAPAWADDLLDATALADSGVVHVTAATRLVERARSRGGMMSGEREEMALVGLLSLQLLYRQYFVEFNERVASLERALQGVLPSVFEDRAVETEKGE